MTNENENSSAILYRAVEQRADFGKTRRDIALPTQRNRGNHCVLWIHWTRNAAIAVWWLWKKLPTDPKRSSGYSKLCEHNITNLCGHTCSRASCQYSALLCPALLMLSLVTYNKLEGIELDFTWERYIKHRFYHDLRTAMGYGPQAKKTLCIPQSNIPKIELEGDHTLCRISLS